MYNIHIFIARLALLVDAFEQLSQAHATRCNIPQHTATSYNPPCERMRRF